VFSFPFANLALIRDVELVCRGHRSQAVFFVTVSILQPASDVNQRFSHKMRNTMTNTFASITRLGALIAFVLLTTSIAFAQSQATTGNIEGRVTDPNGAAVPGATVTATNQETALAKSAATDDGGNYRIIFLPPGKYRVTTSGAQGFAPADYGNVTVTVGGQTPLEIQLKVGATTTMVDISAGGQVVETTQTSVSTTINQKSIENLPINGRNFQQSSGRWRGQQQHFLWPGSGPRRRAPALPILGRVGAGISGESEWLFG